MRKVLAAITAAVAVLGGGALVNPASASPSSASSTTSTGVTSPPPTAVPADLPRLAESPATSVVNADHWYVNHWWVGGSDWSWHTTNVARDDYWHDVLNHEHESDCYDGVFVGVANLSEEAIDHTTDLGYTTNDIFTGDATSWYAGNCGPTFSYAPIVYATVENENWTAANGFNSYYGGRASAYYHCNNAAGVICKSSDELWKDQTAEQETHRYWGPCSSQTMSLWTGDTNYIDIGVRGWDGKTQWFKYSNLGNTRKRIRDC